MTLLKRCATLFGIGGLAVGSVVAACQHEVPAPIENPAHREVGPMAPAPTPTPTEPGVMPPQPVPGEPQKTIPSRPGVLLDGGVAPLPQPANPSMPPSPPTSMMRPAHHVSVAQRDDEVEPQSVPVQRDAAVDGPVSLPPVPDAGPGMLKDAGQPM